MNRARLLADLRRHEGKRLRCYSDTVGVLTIGFGRNLDANGISEDEAELMLANDATNAERVARAWIGDAWESLDATRQEVCVNMAFNLGPLKLAKFVGTRAAIVAGEYETAARRMLESAWAGQVGQRATELSTRMRFGELKPTAGTPETDTTMSDERSMVAMPVRHILESREAQGGIIITVAMALERILPLVGVPLPEGTLVALAPVLAQVAGLIWAAWGNIRRKDLHAPVLSPVDPNDILK